MSSGGSEGSGGFLPPVSFSQPLADAATAAIRQAVTLIDQQAQARQQFAQQALAAWEGRYADDFRARLSAMQARTDGVREELLRLASRIGGAGDQARFEQQRRDQANAERGAVHD